MSSEQDFTRAGVLFARNGIAAAVAREIRNIGLDAGREGLAYKAEWDRRGSDADKHIAATVTDWRVPIKQHAAIT